MTDEILTAKKFVDEMKRPPETVEDALQAHIRGLSQRYVAVRSERDFWRWLCIGSWIALGIYALVAQLLR